MQGTFGIASPKSRFPELLISLYFSFTNSLLSAHSDQFWKKTPNLEKMQTVQYIRSFRLCRTFSILLPKCTESSIFLKETHVRIEVIKKLAWTHERPANTKLRTTAAGQPGCQNFILAGGRFPSCFLFPAHTQRLAVCPAQAQLAVHLFH